MYPQSQGFWTPPYGSPKMGWTAGRKDLLYQAVGLARELTPQLPELPDEDGAASHWAGLKTAGFCM